MYTRTNSLEVIGNFDSDFAGRVDSLKSTSSHIFKLADGAISWRSAKQTLTATFTLEVEFVSCFEASLHGVWLKSFIYELRIVDSISRHWSCTVITQLRYLWLRTTRAEVEVSISTLSTYP